MAKKADVTSFEQYDAGSKDRKKRAGNLADRRAYTLRQTQIKDIGDFAKEEARRIGCHVEVGESGIILVKIGGAGDELNKVLHDRVTACSKEREAFHKAEVAKSYLGSCIDDLVDCGMHLLRTSPDKCLPEGVQYDIYMRLTKELAEVYRNYGALVSDAPGIVEVLNYYFLPRIGEQVEEVGRMVHKLRSKGYIRKRSAETLLFLLFDAPKRRLQKQKEDEAKADSRPSAPVVSCVEEVVESPDVIEDVAGFIVDNFGIDRPVAEEISVGRSIDKVRIFYDCLVSMVGEEGAGLMVSTNPAVLGYSNGKATKFLSNLEDVLKSQREAQQLLGAGTDEFEFNTENAPLFSDFRTLHSLKQELFSRMRAIKFPPRPAEGSIDVEDYKNQLISRAGLDVGVVRAITSGKTLHFTGEVYMPAEYFRKNSSKKIAPQKMAIFADVFDALVKHNVITRKPKTTLLYRFNPNISEIEDKYLREYMRISLHAEQIIAQEGELKLNEDIVKELYPSNGKGVKKP